jgi:molybdate transport system substrate-binding protein
MNRPLKRVIAVGAVAMLSATACGSSPDPTTSITVYAASSLIKSFTAIGKDFEAANPRYSVEFIFASSSELSSALAAGDGADVFASGDRANMAVVANAGAVSGTPEPFASDRLVVVTPAGNPRHLASFADLGQPGLRVTVCGARGACGSATQLVEGRTGIQLHSESDDTTPTHVLKDVTSGNADAGVVFMTDVTAAGDNVSWFPLPGDADATTSWITVIKGTAQDREATQFIAEVTGPRGQQILADDGFIAPLKTPER